MSSVTSYEVNEFMSTKVGVSLGEVSLRGVSLNKHESISKQNSFQRQEIGSELEYVHLAYKIKSLNPVYWRTSFVI